MSSAVFTDLLVHAAAETLCLGLEGHVPSTRARSVTFHTLDTV